MGPSLRREERVKVIKDLFISLMWIAARYHSQWLQSFGLTHPQFMTLASLVAHRQSCAMRDLTEVTFQDPPTMTGIIDRLVKMRLVQRFRSETDRRVVLVQATEAGIDLVRQIKEEATEHDLKVYEALTDEELNQYEQLLRYLLRAHLGQFMALQGAELDSEIEKLQHFKDDPIHYMKQEKEKQRKVH